MGRPIDSALKPPAELILMSIQRRLYLLVGPKRPQGTLARTDECELNAVVLWLSISGKACLECVNSRQVKRPISIFIH